MEKGIADLTEEDQKKMLEDIERFLDNPDSTLKDLWKIEQQYGVKIRITVKYD